MLITKSSFSAQGCYYASSLQIYIDPDGNYSPTIPQYEYRNAADRVLAASYCVRFTGGVNSCYIRNYVGGGGDFGRLVDYSALPCSIDDYTLLLILATGSFGFIMLRKKNFSISLRVS